MPTKISAGVGDHAFFLTMIPIDCKITNFPCNLKKNKNKVGLRIQTHNLWIEPFVLHNHWPICSPQSMDELNLLIKIEWLRCL